MPLRGSWIAALFVISSFVSPIVAAEPAAAPAKPEQKPAAKADEKPTDAEAAKKALSPEDYELYKTIADTMFQIEQNYVEKISRRDLMEAAIRGMLDKLDPHSVYVSPEEISRFKTSVESQFGGIGIQITMDGRQLKVLSPLVGSPAYKAGLQAGDSIVEIEGKTTAGISIDDAVRRLKGEAGTSVTITIVHPGATKRETFTIGREVIRLDTVLGDHRKSDDTWDYMLDHDKKIGYLRITAFSRDTAHDVEQALKTLEKDHLRGLIIDLRFNPGGLLKSATDIADLFVAEGLIVKTEGRNTAPRSVMAKKAGTFEGFPIAVLVNRYSASASEILSACLQDHQRAIVIGERTYGKGSVQNVIDLENGRSALKLTTAGYLRPNGHNIHRKSDAKDSDEWGVMPDKGYEIKLSDSEMSSLVRNRQRRDILIAKSTAEPKTEAKIDAAEKNAEPEKKIDPDAESSEGKKPDDATDSDDKPEAAKKEGDKKQSPGKEQPAANEAFGDRQLQKAIDYLSSELAKAG
jgi:carboxyl-terminal processing protease